MSDISELYYNNKMNNILQQYIVEIHCGDSHKSCMGYHRVVTMIWVKISDSQLTPLG